MFDPERDEDPGLRRFYLRLLTIVVIAAAGCVALWPSVHEFSAGTDHDTGCLAIKDGWHAEKHAPNPADVVAAYRSIPPIAPGADQATRSRVHERLQAVEALPVVQQHTAYLDWIGGPGACVPESRHRLIQSGIGLGSLLAICSGVSLIRKARRPRARTTPENAPDANCPRPWPRAASKVNASSASEY